MKIIYTKNNENFIESLENWDEGKKRYNLLTADSSISSITLINNIKESTLDADGLISSDSDVESLENFFIEEEEEEE